MIYYVIFRVFDWTTLSMGQLGWQQNSNLLKLFLALKQDSNLNRICLFNWENKKCKKVIVPLSSIEKLNFWFDTLLQTKAIGTAPDTEKRLNDIIDLRCRWLCFS